jgi:hypothetical protein
MKLDKFKLNKNKIKLILFKSAATSVGVSVFCAICDFIFKNEFSLKDSLISCLQFFVIYCLMCVVFPWMREKEKIDTENT